MLKKIRNCPPYNPPSLDSHPRRVDVGGSADARSGTDAGLLWQKVQRREANRRRHRLTEPTKALSPYNPPPPPPYEPEQSRLGAQRVPRSLAIGENGSKIAYF